MKLKPKYQEKIDAAENGGNATVPVVSFRFGKRNITKSLQWVKNNADEAITKYQLEWLFDLTCEQCKKIVAYLSEKYGYSKDRKIKFMAHKGFGDSSKELEKLLSSKKAANS